MADWIRSIVTVKAESTKDVEEFRNRVSGNSIFPIGREDAKRFDFARILPYGSGEGEVEDQMHWAETISDIFKVWEKRNWGTAGNAQDVSVDVKSKVVVYDFINKLPPYLVAEKIRRMISSGELPKLEVDWKLIDEDGETLDMFEEIDRMDITKWGTVSTSKLLWLAVTDEDRFNTLKRSIMADWIRSIVTVKAESTKDVEEFINRVSGDSIFPIGREDAKRFDFARIVPYGLGERTVEDQMYLAETMSDIFKVWKKMNWGTAGNAHDVSVDVKSKVVVYDFINKWDPPYLVAEKIRRMISSGELPKLEVDWKLIYDDGATVDMFEEIDRMDITQWGVAYERTLTSWIRKGEMENDLRAYS